MSESLRTADKITQERYVTVTLPQLFVVVLLIFPSSSFADRTTGFSTPIIILPTFDIYKYFKVVQ